MNSLFTHNPLSLVFLLAVALLIPGLAGQTPDTRGPVQIAGARVAVSLDGVQAPGYLWKPFATDPDIWKGLWIQVANNKSADATILRKSFTLDQNPQSVHARIAANGGRYTLYVNGIPVSRGPADQGKDYSRAGKGGGSQKTPFYELRDLTPFFHQGANTVVFLVRGSLLFEAEATMPDGTKQTLVSDASWKGSPANFLHSFVIPAGDQMKKGSCPSFDGALEPVGWSSPGFDDSGWTACDNLHPVTKGTLQPSQLPPCMEAYYPVKEVIATDGDLHPEAGALTKGKSLIIARNGSVDVIFDRVMSGRCGFKIKGGAGGRVYYQTGESVGGKLTPEGVLLLRDGIQTYETQSFNSIAVIHLDFKNVTSPIEVLEVTSDWTSQPVAYEGSFECSDEFLNRLWKTARTSVQINLQTHHLDSPTHQEPISDYGDYLIEDLVAYNAFGTANPWLARQDLRKWAWIMQSSDYNTFHTSYALLWLQALVNYYHYTGDKDLVEELAPFVHGLLGRFSGYLGKTGIVSEAPDYMFMDWVSIQGLGAHHPPANIGMGYMTAFFYRALGDGAEISEILGDKTHVEKYEELRKKIASAYNAQLWDASKGLYRDGISHLTTIQTNAWMPPDTGIDNYSQQNNSLAMAYGLAPSDQSGKLMGSILTQIPWNVQPYFMHFVFDAMEASGIYDTCATEWLRKWKINQATQSLHEGNSMGDLSHGWTSTPLYQLSSRILGVRPESPGFKTILIRPYPCDLKWAKGSVPTPFGNVLVSWTMSEDKFTMDTQIPNGAEAMIEPPASRFTNPKISVDGKQEVTTIHLAVGSHHVELTGDPKQK